MPDMLVVAALELSHPLLLLVLMKADNAALHGFPLSLNAPRAAAL